MEITIKEYCHEIRNSKVINVVNELQQININVDVFDPYADKNEVADVYGVLLIYKFHKTYDGVTLAVFYEEFLELESYQLKSINSSVIFDTKVF